MSTKATNGPGPRPLAPGPCCRARVYRWRTDQTIAVEKALIACEKKGPEARGQGPGEAADEFLQRVRPEKKWAPDVKDEGERIKDEGAGTPNPEIPKSPIP